MAAHKLLLADDSITIQRVIELTFSGEDVHVVAVSDGEQAIARIPVERPDIVLADIGMPKRSGYDVAAFVKGHPDLNHIPVLLLAGAFEPVDEARAKESRCDGVLVKPFEPQHVIARVRELLDGAKGSPTQIATGHVARPVERLTAPTPEPPRAAHPAPITHRESRVAVTEPVGERSLDDYFDRLDAAFATMGGETSAVAPVDPELNVPTLDELLGRPLVAGPPIERPDATPTLSPAPPSVPWPPSPTHHAPAKAGTERNVIAEVFTTMLAVEQGEAGAVPFRLSTAPQEPVVTDALVDEVARRVMQKLSPGAAREVVVQVVSEIAERLVREEIARIRGTGRGQ